jgi:hypothetical protein
MKPIVFDSGDRPFLDWMEKHPSGFVVNTTGSTNTTYLLIHRSKCYHISGYTSRWGEGAFTKNGYIKICSTSVSSLLDWVREHRQRVLTCKPCGTCKPKIEAILPVRSPPTPKASDFLPTERVQMTDYRILRDSTLARWVKEVHNHCCQICGHTILLPSGGRYSEAHHIRPLGSPHNGPDHIANILCVCPNHHAELDYLVRPLKLSELRIHPDHTVGGDFIEYHNQQHTKQ